MDRRVIRHLWSFVGSSHLDAYADSDSDDDNAPSVSAPASAKSYYRATWAKHEFAVDFYTGSTDRQR